MALKPDRRILEGTDISFFMNQTAERGVAVALSSAGSGIGMDDVNSYVALPTTAFGSGQYIVGILMNDVVSGDLTKFHLNYQRDEVQIGGKVAVCRRGFVVTNMFAGSPVGGQAAYVGVTATDGKLTGISNYSGPQALAPAFGAAFSGGALTRIGTWLTSKDADGFAKLDVNLV